MTGGGLGGLARISPMTEEPGPLPQLHRPRCRIDGVITPCLPLRSAPRRAVATLKGFYESGVDSQFGEDIGEDVNANAMCGLSSC